MKILSEKGDNMRFAKNYEIVNHCPNAKYKIGEYVTYSPKKDIPEKYLILGYLFDNEDKDYYYITINKYHQVETHYVNQWDNSKKIQLSNND